MPAKTPSGLKHRPVRLILMEQLEGICIDQLDPARLKDWEKTNLVTKAFDAYQQINFYGGVEHGDLHLRNIMICNNDSYDLASQRLRLVLIDFNISIIPRRCGLPSPSDSSPLPISSIKQFWHNNVFVHTGWLETWEEAEHWLWWQWGGSKFYMPIKRGEEDKSDSDDPNEFW